MMLDIVSWKENDSRFQQPWYHKWKETGKIDKRYMSNEWAKKLKNKRYQLSIGKLDQSFLIWRLMKQKMDGINIQPVHPPEWWAEQQELCRKGLPPYQPK